MTSGLAHKRAVADKRLALVDGVADEQKMYVNCTCHSSGYATSHAITAGQFRAQLEAAVIDEECIGVLIRFDDGGQYDLDYHDFYSITVATPEVEARIAAEEEDDRVIDELIRLGVDRRLFFGSDPHGSEYRAFSATEVHEMSKKVVAFFAGREKPLATE